MRLDPQVLKFSIPTNLIQETFILSHLNGLQGQSQNQ